MLKYLSKFAMDILPSVVATIIGAYIVNHYIVAKPAVDATAATAASTVEPKVDVKPDVRRDVKAAETTPEVSNTLPAGVRAKGISEKAVFEKPEKAAEKSPEKSEDKPAETASIPVETRRHSPTPREKTAAKAAPVTASPPLQPAVSAAPAAVAPPTAPPVEATNTPDASDLARAVIERLRAPRAQEAPRSPEPPRVVSAPQAPPPQAPAVRPLPPPIMVSAPPSEALGAGSGPAQSQGRVDDSNRPTPPADIPSAAPFDLHAEAAGPSARAPNNVAEDMLSAAKSVFHAVLPQ